MSFLEQIGRARLPVFRVFDMGKSDLNTRLALIKLVAGRMTFGLFLSLGSASAATFPAVSSEACLGTRIPTLLEGLKERAELFGVLADVRKVDLKFVVSRGNYSVIGSNLRDEEIKAIKGKITISIYELLPSKNLIELVRNSSVLVLDFDDVHKLISSKCAEVLDGP